MQLWQFGVGGDSGDPVKWKGLECILETQSSGLANGLDVRSE